MDLVLAAALLLPLTFSALVTAYIAHMNDRSLGRWLLFGFCVPFVAIFVAMLVTYLDQRRAGKAGEDAE
jgi:hypothetical protein